MIPARFQALLPLMVLVASATVLGLAPILVRLTETGPAAAGFWRVLFAVPFLALLTLRPGGEGVGRPSRWMALAGVFFFMDLAFWHYGVVMTSVANATVLCNLAPVLVAVFAWLALKARPGRRFVLALCLTLAGALAMAVGADGGQGTNPVMGDLLSVSVAVWAAGYYLAVQAARVRAGAARVMLWSSAVCAPFLLAAAGLLGEDILPETLAGWGACLGLGLVHAVGQGGVAWSLGRLPAAVAALGVLIQPVAAAVLAWLLFAETMTPIQIGGGALVLLGVVMAQRTTRNRPPTALEMQTGAESLDPAPVTPSNPGPVGPRD